MPFPLPLAALWNGKSSKTAKKVAHTTSSQDPEGGCQLHVIKSIMLYFLTYELACSLQYTYKHFT